MRLEALPPDARDGKREEKSISAGNGLSDELVAVLTALATLQDAFKLKYPGASPIIKTLQESLSQLQRLDTDLGVEMADFPRHLDGLSAPGLLELDSVSVKLDKMNILNPLGSNVNLTPMAIPVPYPNIGGMVDVMKMGIGGKKMGKNTDFSNLPLPDLENIHNAIGFVDNGYRDLLGGMAKSLTDQSVAFVKNAVEKAASAMIKSAFDSLLDNLIPPDPSGVCAAIQGLRKAYKYAKLAARLANTGMKMMRKRATAKIQKMLKGRVKGGITARALRSKQQMEEYAATAKKSSVKSMLSDKITLNAVWQASDYPLKPVAKKSFWKKAPPKPIRLKINIPTAEK